MNVHSWPDDSRPPDPPVLPPQNSLNDSRHDLDYCIWSMMLTGIKMQADYSDLYVLRHIIEVNVEDRIRNSLL